MTKTLDRLFKGIDVVLGIMLGFMILFVFLNVVLRVFFNSGLTWSEELARYIFVYITYIGAIGAMRSNSHLGMDSIMGKLPPKTKRVVYIIAQIMIAAVMLMVAHGAMKMTIQSVEAKAAATGIPLSIIFGIGIITGICIVIICISNIVKVIKEPALVDQMVKIYESEDEELIEEMKKLNDDLNNDHDKKS